MKKIISVVLVSMMFSTSAFAWGDREQGILTGVAGLWIFQQLNKAGQPQNPPVVVYQQPQPPVYNTPQPYVSPPMQNAQRMQQYCESTTIVDQFGGNRLVQYCYWK